MMMMMMMMMMIMKMMMMIVMMMMMILPLKSADQVLFSASPPHAGQSETVSRRRALYQSDIFNI